MNLKNKIIKFIGDRYFAITQDEIEQRATILAHLAITEALTQRHKWDRKTAKSETVNVTIDMGNNGGFFDAVVSEINKTTVN